MKDLFHLASHVGEAIAPLGMASLLLLGYAMPAGATLTTDNLLIQLDGTDVTSSGGFVDSWNDQSALGGSENFSQTIGASRPALASGTILPNGTPHNVVNFDGVNDFLQLGADSDMDGGTFSWFMVLRFNNLAGTDYAFANGYTSGAGVSSNFDKWSTISSSAEAINAAVRSSSASLKATGLADATAGEWYLLSNVWDSGTGVIDVRSFDKDNTDTLSPLSDSQGTGATGAGVGHLESNLGSRASGEAFDFDGSIAELLVYDVALGDSAREATEQFLLDKYFVVTAVPEAGLLPLWALGTCWFGLTWRRHQKKPE